MKETYLDESYIDESLPEKVYVEATDMCNLSCTMCFRHSWIDEKEGRMELPSFLKLAEELETLPFVKECFFGGMGEPLSHPLIIEMLRAVPGRIKKTMITNATMLSEEISEELIGAGLNELWISMDGFCLETYEQIQKGSEFREILKNLDGFNRKRAGKNVRLCTTFVLTGSNEKELAGIDAFADRFGIDEINVSREIPGTPVKEGYLTEADPEKVPLGKMRRLSEGIVTVEEDKCPFITENAVFIKWNGDVVPCMQLLHSTKTYLYGEERKIKAFSYGNIGTDSLMECWENEAYRKFRTRVREFYFPFCRYCEGCADRKENLSDCFVSEAPACGACLWASGRVFCP